MQITFSSYFLVNFLILKGPNVNLSFGCLILIFIFYASGFRFQHFFCYCCTLQFFLLTRFVGKNGKRRIKHLKLIFESFSMEKLYENIQLTMYCVPLYLEHLHFSFRMRVENMLNANKVLNFVSIKIILENLATFLVMLDRKYILLKLSGLDL